MKVVYEWLKDYVGEDIPRIEELEKLFTFHAFEIDGIETIEGMKVIDVKVLPDRASDCLSHRGIARELATLTGKPLAHDPLTHMPELTPKTQKVSVSIEDAKHCRRFSAAVMSGITVKESPEWLRERLVALGQRPINNVVDATNYVMLALGHPLHAYDGEKFSDDDGVWRFGVRMAREGEEVTILGGAEITLAENVQLIVNAKDDAPVGIAGIKGGKSAEIDAGTTTVILEAANFDPQVTRRGAQALRLQTDASKRFENNLSPDLVPFALTHAVSLIKDIAGGKLEGYIDEYPGPTRNQAVAVTLEEMNRRLGIELSNPQVEDILSRLGFSYSIRNEAYDVVAPFERTDILIPDDVIAEVGRVHGYEHIVSIRPEAVPLREVNARHYYSEKIRSILTREGFSEVITSSFRKKDEIELQNALASDKGCLRSSLKENIREVLEKNMPNADLLGLESIRVFEIGTVFTKTPDDVTEHVSLALGVRMKQQGHSPKDDAHLLEVRKKLGEMLGMTLEEAPVKGVLEIDLSTHLHKLPQPEAYEPFIPEDETLFTPYSSFPFIARDIALWVPESVSVSDVEQMIREHAGDLLQRITLFDEFKKNELVSFAFRLVFQSYERTLTDGEVGSIMEKLGEESKKRGFTVR